MGSSIYGHIWKWLAVLAPLIFPRRRQGPCRSNCMKAARISNGASRLQKFTLNRSAMAGMYLVCTMLSTIWAWVISTPCASSRGGDSALSTICSRPWASATHSNWGDPQAGACDGADGAALADPVVILLMRQFGARGHDMTAHAPPRVVDSIGRVGAMRLALVWDLLPIYTSSASSVQKRRSAQAPPSTLAPSPHAFSVVFHRPSGCWRHSGTRWATVFLSCRCRVLTLTIGSLNSFKPSAACASAALDADQRCAADPSVSPDVVSWPSFLGSWANMA